MRCTVPVPSPRDLATFKIPTPFASCFRTFRSVAQQIELSEGHLHVHRVKNGISSVHPIRGDEMRALRKLRRDYPTDAYVFVSERGGPISPIGFHRLIQRLGEAAKMPFPIHPHMLRHACGFKLANDGHDTRALQHYLGHKNIQHTVRYTEMAPDRFKDFWRG